MMLTIVLTGLAIRGASAMPVAQNGMKQDIAPTSIRTHHSSTSHHPSPHSSHHRFPPIATSVHRVAVQEAFPTETAINTVETLVPTPTQPEQFPMNPESNHTSDLLHERDFVQSEGCTWGDWAGDKIPCDTYSLIFDDETGDPNAYYTSKVRRRSADDATDKQLFAIRGWADGKVWTYRGELYCPDAGADWEDFHVAQLPWSLAVHGGNACQHVLQGFAYDNTWVKYANQYVNAPTDGRCQLVGTEDLAMRCLIQTRPQGAS